MGLYATDGVCHNAEPGTFNSECGKPAVWIGEDASGFRSGFCEKCKAQGFEAKVVTKWKPIPLPEGWTWARVISERAKWEIKPNMIPVACAPGCVAWGTINSEMTEAA